MKPLVFVVMPFGKKKHPSSCMEFDFNDFYHKVFDSLNSDPELDMIFVREDMVDTNGCIQTTMIEKLLLAEYVIADLSFANANVFWELGVRHCAKPRTTFLISSEKCNPFDIATQRTIQYQITNCEITDDEIENLKQELKSKLLRAKTQYYDTDSPVYNLIPSLNINIELPEDETKSFMDRALLLNGYLEEINRLKNNCSKDNKAQTINNLKDIQLKLGEFSNTNSVIFHRLIEVYRDLEEYNTALELINSINPTFYTNSKYLHQEKGFLENRLGLHANAKLTLQQCIKRFGQDSETYGRLGRVYKDLYDKSTLTIDKKANLDKAIELYALGYSLDVKNFYTGINLANLLFLRHSDDDIQQMKKISTALLVVLENIDLNYKDYWAWATELNCHLLLNNIVKAYNIFSKLFQDDTPIGQYKSTLRDIEKVYKQYCSQGLDFNLIKEMIQTLKEKIGSGSLV